MEIPKLIGVVHLPPLPGSFNYQGDFESIIEFAVRNAKRVEEGGFDGVILENFNDKPFRKRVKPETAIAMAMIAKEVKKSISIKLGINLLRNSAYEATSIAGLTGDFIRVNALCETISSPEGIIEPASVEVQEAIQAIRRKVMILADVFVKHASPLHSRSLKDVIMDCKERGLADGIIITGKRTGEEASVKMLKEAKRYGLPVCIG
ncbi:MAG: BtpA/SgcQ family protein, partial [Sulfolobus sp.]|nr:BtpA/SgcQ family protein [Sulfolobus sp.]